MKRILSLFLLAVIAVIPLCAQTPEAEQQTFNPHWYIQAQGGVGHTLGEADFGKLLSPSAALSVGRQFTPVWALRVGFSGWQGKGAWYKPSQIYKFNFLQTNVDLMVDLANLIGDFRIDRTVNPYVLLGMGGNTAFNNGQAKEINDAGHKLSLLWTGSKFVIAARVGAGVNFRMNDHLLLGMEVNTNMLPDKFNSKRAGNADWQMNVIVGLTYSFGNKNKKTTKPKAAPVMAPTAVVESVIPVVETPAMVEEVVLVVEAPVVVEEMTPAVKPPAPVAIASEVKKDAPTPPSPDSYKTRKDVFFAINSSELATSENVKIDALVESLKANPQARVSVVGYSDAPTGNSMGNYWLSGWRAIRVRDALKKKGVGASRIDMNFVGDREQPYSDVQDNRVVICIVR